MQKFRLSLDQASDVLRKADCNGNSTIGKVVKSLQGGLRFQNQDHLKGHGDVSWDKNSAVEQQSLLSQK